MEPQHAAETLAAFRFGEACMVVENAASSGANGIAALLAKLDAAIAKTESAIQAKERWEVRSVMQEVDEFGDGGGLRQYTELVGAEAERARLTELLKERRELVGGRDPADDDGPGTSDPAAAAAAAGGAVGPAAESPMLTAAQLRPTFCSPAPPKPAAGAAKASVYCSIEGAFTTAQGAAAAVPPRSAALVLGPASGADPARAMAGVVGAAVRWKSSAEKFRLRQQQKMAERAANAGDRAAKATERSAQAEKRREAMLAGKKARAKAQSERLLRSMAVATAASPAPVVVGSA